MPRKIKNAFPDDSHIPDILKELLDQLSPLFLAVTTACRGTDEKGCHESKLRNIVGACVLTKN